MTLAFPGSNAFPGPKVVEFRDGARSVPEYVADLLAAIDTSALTYDEAIAAMNDRLLGGYVAGAVDAMIDMHLDDQR
jgi:hypothetical protein